jgi:hypothetical protein
MADKKQWPWYYRNVEVFEEADGMRIVFDIAWWAWPFYLFDELREWVESLFEWVESLFE